jgi:ABC-2 type transport system ATP-binding protein
MSLPAITATPRHPSAATPAPAIVVRGARKAYGPITALDGLDLRVERGEVYAFLGPNGAGKTTMVEILEGFRVADAGHIDVLGADPASAPLAWRESIGVVLQESAPDPGLTVRQTLELHAGYHARPRDIDATLSLAGLLEQASRPAPQLSGGQRRRLDLALAVIGDPELIFLDEPTTGFDPAARRVAWDVIEGLRDTGVTVFLTTHSMEEAERLADRIGVIVGGRLVAEGSPESLGGRDRGDALVSFTLPPAVAAADLPAGLAGHPRADQRRVTFATPRPLEDVERLAAWARNRRTGLADLEVRRPSLEDVYLRLTGSRQGGEG